MVVNVLKKENIPYICTPLTGETELKLFEQLEKIIGKEPDLIEWRADFFANLANTEVVLSLIEKIKLKTKIPLLFTIRAEHEGGEKISLTEEEKVQLICHVCEKTSIDLVDYEISNDEKFVQKIQETVKKNNKILILSYHNFNSTPDNDELVERAHQAMRLGADVVKIAVMPEMKSDVFRLLDVTKLLDEQLAVPVITMSMGELGAISRIIGWSFGSVMTFAVGVEVSAPGQMEIEPLRKAIQATQTLVPKWLE